MLFNYRARKAEQVDMARAIMVAMIVSVGGFRYTTFIYICKMLPFDLTKTGTEKCLRKVVKANPELFNGCCDYVTRGSEFHTSVIKYTPELQAYVAKALVDFTTPEIHQ
jgi:hypothetical protein